MPLNTTEIKQALTTIANTAARGVSTAMGGAPPPGGPQGVFDVSNDGLTWRPTVRVRAGSGTSFSVVDGEATVTAAALGEAEYATRTVFRESPPPADGAIFRIVSPPGEYRYSTSSGAGWADDDDTILKPDSILVGANGRAFSTRASEHAATFAAARAMKGILGRAKHVHVESHTTFGDGGGGVFDVKDNSGGAYTDDDGIYIEAGGVALIRRVENIRRKKAVWWGIVPGADITVRFRTLLAAAQYGDVLVFGRGRYTISDTVDIENRGLTIEGQGGLDPNPYVDTGTIFIGSFPVISGAAASIGTVAIPVDADARLVTYTGLTGLASVDPGDMIQISGAALERNNGYFTIISVDSGSGSVTCHVYNQFIHTVDYQWHVTATGETNDGALAWEIRKPMFRIHNETRFRDVFFNGANTVSVLVDSGFKGSSGTPGAGPYDGCTGNRFHGCRWRSAYQGLSIGGFGNYVAGGATDISWATNCDLHLLHDVSFIDCNHSAICIPSASGTAVLHDLKFVSISECGIGIAVRKGSFKANTLNFAANTHVDLLVQVISNPILISGGHSEGTPRFLVVGSYGYFASTGTVIPVQVENYRADSNVALPADNCYIQTGTVGGVSFRNCLFESSIGNANWTIGVQGRATNGTDDLHANSTWITFESCVFPVADTEQIVTTLAGSVGLNPFWYHTLGCCAIQPTGTYIPVRIADGTHAAKNSPVAKSPSTQVLMLCEPAIASTDIVNGANNAVPLPKRSTVTDTGPTADVTINGMIAGSDGQVVTRRLKYAHQTTVSHLSVSAANGDRFVTSTAADVVLAAPAANGYNLLRAVYDPTEDSGNGAWVML